MQNKYTSFIGYGMGDFALNLFWTSLTLLLLYWYTNVVKIGPVMAGIIFFVGTMTDAISDPVMAVIAERSAEKWGSYKRYLLLGGVMASLGFIVLFSTPEITFMPIFVWLLFTHIVFRVSYTIINIPYSALSSRLTQDSHERTIVSGIRMAFGYTSNLVVSFYAFPIIRFFGDGRNISNAGFVIFAVICSICATTVFVLAYFLIDEKPREQRRRPARTLRQEIRLMVFQCTSNDAVRTALAMIGTMAAGTFILSAMLAFLVDSFADILRSKEAILGVNAAIMLMTTPLWTAISKKYGKRRLWIAVSVLACLTCIHLGATGPFVVSGYILQLFMLAACTSCYGVLMWSMIPDLVEYGEIKTGQRSEATVFGLTILFQKLSIAIAGMVIGFLLEFIGYSGEKPSGAAQYGIFLIYAVLPCLFLFLSAVAAYMHPVSVSLHKEAVRTLNRPVD